MTTKKKPAPAPPAAIRCLERVLARRENQRILTEALEKALQDNPYQFFKAVILPLLPKPLKLAASDDKIRKAPAWTPLCDISRTPPSEPSTMPDPTDSAPSAADGDSARPSASPPS